MSYLYYILGFFAYVLIDMAVAVFIRWVSVNYGKPSDQPVTEETAFSLGVLWPLTVPLIILLTLGGALYGACALCLNRWVTRTK